MQPRLVMNVVQHRIVNVLKMRSFFFCDLKNKQKPVNCMNVIDYKIAYLGVEMVGHICFVVLTS